MMLTIKYHELVINDFIIIHQIIFLKKTHDVTFKNQTLKQKKNRPDYQPVLLIDEKKRPSLDVFNSLQNCYQ